jgi:hypothetical protein
MSELDLLVTEMLCRQLMERTGDKLYHSDADILFWKQLKDELLRYKTLADPKYRILNVDEKLAHCDDRIATIIRNKLQ